MLYQIGGLKNFAKFAGKNLQLSLFLMKMQALTHNFIKITLWYWCFPVIFAETLKKTLL